MRYIHLILFFYIGLLSAAEFNSATVIVKDRNKSNKIVSKPVIVSDLISTTHFNGKYFKILRKDTQEFIRIDPTGNNIESLRAATAYYHLTKARLYYKSLGIEQKEVLTVRIGIENKFHKKYHFQNVEVSQEYNNAHTFSPGEGIEKYGIAPWGKEVWLRSPKKVEVGDEFKNSYRNYTKAILPDNGAVNLDIIIFNILHALIASEPKNYLENSATGILQNYVLNKTLRLIIPEVALAFSEKEFFLDSALIPEVIIHEYTHFMMSDYIPTVENIALLEGLSDYFATKISNNSQIAKNLGKQGSLIKHRDSGEQVYYSYLYDVNRPEYLGVGTSYVLSTLTLIDTYLSKYEGPDFAAKAFFEMRKELSIDSKIYSDFPSALLNVTPAKYRLGILGILNSTGL